MAKPSARPVRRQDIHFKRSLFRFTLSFILVFVAGLFTRVFLQNYPLKEKILDKILVPDRYELKIDKVQFSFRSGLFPVIGVAINRVDWLDKKCTLKKASAQDLLLSLDSLALLTGNIRLGHVEVDYLEGTAVENCKEIADIEGGASVGAAVAKPLDGGGEAKTQASDLTRIVQKVFSQIEEVTGNRPFNELTIRNLQLDWQGDKEGAVHLEARAHFDLSEELVADLVVGKLRYAENDLSFVDSSWKLLANKNLIHLRTETSVREGEMVSQIRIENSNNYDTSIKGSLRRIPLSTVMKIFVVDVDFSYLWANCDFETQGPLQEIKNQKILIGNCQIDGPYGEIVVQEMDSSFSHLEKIKLAVNEVVLDKILENKRRLYFSGVFSSYGILSSEVSYQEGLWEGTGVLENSEFIFSNNNLRDIQKVKKIPFQFANRNSLWKASVGDLDLDDGHFEGEVSLQQGEKGETSGRIAIHKIQLNPRIYHLILNSEPTELRIYGKFNWAEEKDLQWSAMLATEELKSDFYDLKFVKVKGNNQTAGESRLRVSVSEGVVKPKGPFLDWIEPTDLDEKLADGMVKFNELTTRLTVHKNREVSWNRGYVRLANGWQLSSEGTRDSSKNVRAWLQWDRPDRKYLRWNYIGTFFEGRWTPETQWVKTWLNSNPEFLKDNKNISFTAASQGSFTEKINRASKKAIQKVKEVLKTDKEDTQK